MDKGRLLLNIGIEIYELKKVLYAETIGETIDKAQKFCMKYERGHIKSECSSELYDIIKNINKEISPESFYRSVVTLRKYYEQRREQESRLREEIKAEGKMIEL